MYEVRIYLEEGDHVFYEDERMIGKPSIEAIETIKGNAVGIFETLYNEEPKAVRIQVMDCRHPSALPGARQQDDGGLSGIFNLE